LPNVDPCAVTYRDLLERITVKINRHMSAIKACHEELFPNRFDPFQTTDLSIYRAPYTSVPLPGP